MQRMLRFLAAVLMFTAAACNTGRHSPAGFRLPEDGNLERGRTVFLEMQCHNCHEVAGQNLPRPAMQPAVPVRLGGEVARELTDGYLVTSIIYPSYVLAHHSKDMIAAGGKSRMPDYADKVTARQLTDLVSYLQSSYVLRQPVAKYTF